MIRALVLLVAYLAAICVYTVGFFPALDYADSKISASPARAGITHAPKLVNQPRILGRPALRSCYYASSDKWVEDGYCVEWGGYALVWRELCEQDARCYQRYIKHQQRCLDRPKSCFKFLRPRR